MKIKSLFFEKLFEKNVHNSYLKYAKKFLLMLFRELIYSLKTILELLNLVMICSRLIGTTTKL